MLSFKGHRAFSTKTSSRKGSGLAKKDKLTKSTLQTISGRTPWFGGKLVAPNDDAPDKIAGRQIRCCEEIRPQRTCQSKSRRAAGPQFVEGPFPTRPTKTPGFLEAERFCRQGSKCEVDCLSFCGEAVTAHDLLARPVIDVHIGA